LAILTTPQGFPDAVWAAWSWMHQASDSLILHLYVDGELSIRQKSEFHRCFPGSAIIERDQLLDWQDGHSQRLMPFLRGHPMGRKLAIALKLQRECSFVYSDSDVILFSKPAEILAFAHGEGGNRYIQEESTGCFDPWLLDKVRKRGLGIAETMNGGLLLIRQDSLDLDLACDLLEDWNGENIFWFTEQTLMAVLMHGSGSVPLPRERYVVSNQRQFYWEDDVDYSNIAARHFTGPVRHVMYSKGVPNLLKHGVPSARVAAL
jgi:hypothetical protein